MKNMYLETLPGSSYGGVLLEQDWCVGVPCSSGVAFLLASLQTYTQTDGWLVFLSWHLFWGGFAGRPTKAT